MSRLARPTGRRHFSRGVLLSILGAGACRRQQESEIPDVWDDDTLGDSSASGDGFAPSWPPLDVSRSEAGMLYVWLREPDSPALHLRWLSARHLETAEDAAATAIAADLFQARLQARLARHQFVVELRERPGRVEFAVHGHDADVPAAFASFIQVCRSTPAGASLAAARSRVQKQTRGRSTEDTALASLVDVLHLAPWMSLGAVDNVSERAIAGAWSALTDVSRNVLFAHSARVESPGMFQTWRPIRARADAPSEIVARLGPNVAISATAASRLVAVPEGSPIPVYSAPEPGSGAPTAVLGRLLELRSASERALARLTQRLLQEELDARISIAGARGLLAIVVPLDGRDADERLAAVLARVDAFATSRQPRQRLVNAAHRWLGSRMIDLSLHGEDWTDLLSEAVDLSDRDDQLRSAIARDAAYMFNANAGSLAQWQSQWLRPRDGEPGWVLTVGGGDERLHKQLTRALSSRAR